MKRNFYKIMEYGFLGLLIIQFGFVMYFNLSDIRCSLDPDFANTIYHYTEVIKNGTLNLQNWYHTTSLELDGTMLFAVPLYYLLGDIFKAIGVSNIVITLLYIIVIGRLLKCYNIEKMFIYLVLTLIITPYEYGMLDWFNMLFYGGACYAIKTIVPIMLLLLLSLVAIESYKTKIGKIEFGLFLAVYIFLLFATVFSTGIFVVLCGLLPILVWSILEMFIKGNPEYIQDKKVCGLWITSAITYMGG